MGERAKGDIFVGTNAISVRRDNMRIQGVMNEGIIADWDAAEALIEHTFKSCLSCDSSEHPLLMAEPSFNPLQTREKLAEIAFEKFSAPAFFLSKNAVLTAFASGRGTALVLDVGGGVTSATAVHDGYVLGRPLKRHNLGGDAINEVLLKSWELRNPSQALQPLYTLKRTTVGPGEVTFQAQSFPNTHPSFHRYSQLQVIREMKECVCRCSMIAPTESIPLDASSWEYELPDHSVGDFSWERFHVPELLFNPSVLRTKPPPWLKSDPPAAADGAASSDGSASLSPGAAELAGLVPEGVVGLPELVSDCIKSCDTDMRRELWGGVVVSGGGSLLPGLTERLHGRLNELVPQMSMKVKLVSPPTPQERRFSVWIGGSILASLGSFQQLWVSKQEYEEHGASILQRRCP
uniref:Actin-related protein 4 n=1 Tax=Haptolina ericina TaxID=156174 RepID=A0A7S3C203_9EUKA